VPCTESGGIPEIGRHAAAIGGGGWGGELENARGRTSSGAAGASSLGAVLEGGARTHKWRLAVAPPDRFGV